MSITQLTTDLNYHQALGDLPNTNDGLTATALKVRYDQAVNDIKTYINSTLIADLEAVTAGASGAHKIGSASIVGVTGANVNDQIANLYSQMAAIVLGDIPDRSLTAIKIGLLEITAAEIANLTITAAKIALLAVGTAQLADNAVTYDKMDSDSQADLIGGEIYVYKNWGGF